MSSKVYSRVAATLFVLLASAQATAAASAEERNLSELRNTVVNLLQALVERGVVTRDQAEKMVRDAQAKAEAETAAQTAQEKAEEGAVRVPYIPQTVKEEIRKEVVAELGPGITKEVVTQASTQDSLRAALPDWARRITLTGDVRVRGEGTLYADNNASNTYLNIIAINNAGSLSKAGANALINTSVDRDRLRARLRFGLEADLGSGWSAALRVATGNLSDPVSTNQTLGNYGNRYQLGVDQAYLRWNGETGSGRQGLTFTGGRMPNPWLASELIFDPDLMFEGVTASYRWNFSLNTPHKSNVYATIGAFPLQEVELSHDDKWLVGGQLGLDWRTEGGHRYRFGVGYYDYRNTVGQLNAPDSTLLDFTAPTFVQKGNTLFNIRNSTTDKQALLYGLAAEYRLLDAVASAEWRLSDGYSVALLVDYVDNIGYDKDEVLARIGSDISARNKGYNVEASFGSKDLGNGGAWRASFAYRYLERDAVIDAFTDSDFHLGGTDAKGYVITLDYAFASRAWARLRYLSANEIDGPPLGIDVWQLDLNTRF